MILTGTERYRWLARRSPANRRPRHVFVEQSDFSLCTAASRYGLHDEWVPDAEREDCRVCRRELAKDKCKGLTEVTW